ASSALMVTETRGASPAESQRVMLEIVFETISAFGTVGLSLGQTPELSDAGKLIISLVMFMGRTGPLTLALAISLRQRREQYRFAEENVMVG
ncbi:MAG TPA: potassium transporter TrkG, partial [Blastocatellia bacterium]|nr:potassium transporter TrkG [Blastocatellia bacterium]